MRRKSKGSLGASMPLHSLVCGRHTVWDLLLIPKCSDRSFIPFLLRAQPIWKSRKCSLEKERCPLETEFGQGGQVRWGQLRWDAGEREYLTHTFRCCHVLPSSFTPYSLSLIMCTGGEEVPWSLQLFPDPSCSAVDTVLVRGR